MKATNTGPAKSETLNHDDATARPTRTFPSFSRTSTIRSRNDFSHA